MKIRKYISYTLKEFNEKKKLNVITSAFLDFSNWYSLTKSKKISQIPWLNFRVIEFLETWLKKDMKVFEYGSGSSTLFFAKRTESVVSIEHDLIWYNKVKSIIEEESIVNVDYKCVLPEPNNLKSKILDYKNPLDYFTSDIDFQEFNFEAYTKAILNYPNDYFDLIIIDGRARPSCIYHSITKLKKGGYLLVDNTERSYYLDYFNSTSTFKGWSIKEFRGHVPGIFHYCSTTLLRKI
jgi:hypothetical protein